MKISDADVLFAIYLQNNNCTIEKLMNFFYKTNQEEKSDITIVYVGFHSLFSIRW